jgi:hypothetical protein
MAYFVKDINFIRLYTLIIKIWGKVICSGLICNFNKLCLCDREKLSKKDVKNILKHLFLG